MRPARPLARHASAALLLFLATSARADCPGSTFLWGALDPANPIPEVAARVDTTFSTQPCDRVHGRYDVLAGLLIASIDVACTADFGRTATGLETVVEDDYVLVGPSPGTPVAFDVALQLSGEGHSFSEPGFGQGGARLTASIVEGAGPPASFQRATTGLEPSIFVNEALVLSVTETSGSPFHLKLAVRAEAFEGRGSLDGLLAFRGLPPGASVQSCRGYSSAAPVAARLASWGRLKAIYR